MTRILITRLGGIGDLMFIEPVLRAIHQKYAPSCEIVFRTYIDFYTTLEYHPLISDIVCDTNEYYLGYRNDMKPRESQYWRHIDPNFNLHIDFQGIIEKGIEGQPYEHVVHSFAKHAGVTVENIIPQVPFLKKEAPCHNIVVQLESDGKDKCLSENKNILETLKEYEDVHFVGKEKTDYHVFISAINNCNLFIGTESCGVTIARALNKPTIGFYTNEVRKVKLAFDKMTTLTFNQTHKLKEAIESYEPHL